MKKPSKGLPFESDWLLWIYGAILSRGKGIRYQGRLRCGRELDHGIERLNVDVGRGFRMVIWADGLGWIWAKHDTSYVEIRGMEPCEVVARLKKSILSPSSARQFWPPYEGEPETGG